MTVVLIAGHLWRTKFPGRTSNLHNPEIWRPKYHKAQRKTVSWRGQIQCLVAIQLISATFIMESLVSQWLLAALGYHSANSPQTGCSQRHRFSRAFACSSVNPSFPQSHPHRQGVPREAFITGSFHSGRDAGQQGKGCFPLQGDICLFHTFTQASLQHLLCKGTARSGGRCEK